MAYSYADRKNAVYGTPILDYEDWKYTHPNGTKKDYYKELDRAQLDADLDSGLSYADRKIQEQNAMIEQEKKLRPGLKGKIRMGLNKLKNRILHPFVSRDLENDAALQEQQERADRIRAMQGNTTSTSNNVRYVQAPMQMIPTMQMMSTMQVAPTQMISPAQNVRYVRANSVMPANGQLMVASFTPKQKSYWGKINLFSGVTPYSKDNTQVQQAIAQAQQAQATADQLRAQAQTTQVNPPAPVLYQTQSQPAVQYQGGAYTQPQVYTPQPNLAPGTNQIAVRAANDPIRKPSLLDDAKQLWGKTTDKIGSYLDSKGIDREKAKKAAIAAALGTMGVATLGTTLSKKRLQNENDDLRAKIAELEERLNDDDRHSRSSRKKKKSRDYYDDDDEDGGDDYEERPRKSKKRNQEQQQQQGYGGSPVVILGGNGNPYGQYQNYTSNRKKRGMKSQIGKRS